MGGFVPIPKRHWAEEVARLQPVTIEATGGARDAVMAALKQFGQLPACFQVAETVTIMVTFSK